ncbi:10244_t:CDS:2, partial [Dentiscutata heterogama]
MDHATEIFKTLYSRKILPIPEEDSSSTPAMSHVTENCEDFLHDQ